MRTVGKVGLMVIALGALLVGCGDPSDTTTESSETTTQSPNEVVVVDPAAEIRAASEATTAQEWLQSRLVVDQAMATITTDSSGTPDGSLATSFARGGGVEAKSVQVDGVVYLDSSMMPTASLEPGKRWIALPLSAAPDSMSSSASEQFALLGRISDNVEELGSDTVNDVRSDGYAFTVGTKEFVNELGTKESFEAAFGGSSGMDPADLYDLVGVADAAGFYERLFGDVVPVEVWVGDGLIRRLVIELEPLDDIDLGVPELEEVAATMATTTTFDLLGAGDPIPVTTPDPALVQQASSYEEYFALITGGALGQ